MSIAAEELPLTATLAPSDPLGVASAVREAFDADTPVYPIGGGTSLNFGLPPKRPGVGLSLENLNRVIDYPARDMTITVEAGVTMQALADVLKTERQWLPIDTPQPEKATLGGVIATAWSGPRRYGSGTMRDYVIGISAVDGRGMPFKGGGRVVKNVAGYDFCKLLTGSLGALGVITQVTLKIRPLPESSVIVLTEVNDWNAAETVLAALVGTATIPAAIELLAGPAWQDLSVTGDLQTQPVARIAVGLEGTGAEVAWMRNQLASEWQALGQSSTVISGDACAVLWRRLRDFPSAEPAPLVLKASIRPSTVTSFAQLALTVDPRASIQAHAGNGVVVVRFSQFEAADISAGLIGKLQPAARAAEGNLVVLSSQLGDLTRQATWGCGEAAFAWMNQVKRQFDPKGLLNRGRFVYS